MPDPRECEGNSEITLRGHHISAHVKLAETMKKKTVVKAMHRNLAAMEYYNSQVFCVHCMFFEELSQQKLET